MGLFDIFRKKNEFSEGDNKNKPLASLTVTSKNIVQFEGLNTKLFDLLYFIDEEQKNKLIKFTNYIIERCSLKEINTSEAYNNFLTNQYEKYYELIDEYPEKYKEYNERLEFPYFNWSELVKFNHGYKIISHKSESKVSESEIKWNKTDEVNSTPQIAEFNLINKCINGEKDTQNEINILNKFINEPDCYYNVLETCTNALINYYIENKDEKHVEDVLSIFKAKINSSESSKVEDKYCSVAFKFESKGNEEMCLVYLNKAVMFVRDNIKKPTKKDTGHSFKHLAEALEKSGDKKKALEIAKEGFAYNDKLPLKRLISKLEK